MFADNKRPFFYELFQTFVFIIIKSIDVVEAQLCVLLADSILALMVYFLAFAACLLKIRNYFCELKTELVVGESEWDHLDAN